MIRALIHLFKLFFVNSIEICYAKLAEGEALHSSIRILE